MSNSSRSLLPLRLYKVLITPLFTFIFFQAHAQELSRDTADTIHHRNIVNDTGFLAHHADTSVRHLTPHPRKPATDSSVVIVTGTILSHRPPSYRPIDSAFAAIFNHDFLSLKASDPFYSSTIRKGSNKEIVFYIITGFLLFIGVIRVFYSKYLTNVFRVFFNTSLRQGQLTDMLVQAHLSSFIFNIAFFISAGLYFWLLFSHYGLIPQYSLLMLPVFVATVVIIYCIKFMFVKFFGWLAGLKASAAQYVFIIFLINKIIGFLLLPFIILIAFGPAGWQHTIILLSWLLLATLFIVRYFRTYGLLQPQLRISPFHFLIYLGAVEILPILLIYKSVLPLTAYLSQYFRT